MTAILKALNSQAEQRNATPFLVSRGQTLRGGMRLATRDYSIPMRLSPWNTMYALVMLRIVGM